MSRRTNSFKTDNNREMLSWPSQFSNVIENVRRTIKVKLGERQGGDSFSTGFDQLCFLVMWVENDQKSV